MPVRETLIAGCAACLFGGPLAAAADLIVRNGRIITQDGGNRIVEAIAVRDGRIVQAGDDASIARLARSATRIIDAGGRTVIPGLIDSHIHAIRAGLTPGHDVSFSGARTIADAMNRIKVAAAGASAEDWIVVAGGWTEHQFAEGRLPSSEEIIAAANGRPVFIQLFYRAAFISPAGMKALGLRDATLPGDARSNRDGKGVPTGWISGDAAAITALYAKLPRATLAHRMRGTQRFFSTLNSVGVTGVIDPGGHNLEPQDYNALFALWRQKKLSVRVAYSICAPTPGRELEEYKKYLQFLPSGFGDGYLRFNGIGERVTWDFYNKDNPTPEATRRFEEIARWAADNRVTMTVHWNRAQSSHHLFAALERVAARTAYADLRWSVAHLHDATPQTLSRLQSLGLGWLTQNAIFFAAPAFLADHAKRLSAAPPLGSALASGLKTGGGTDASRVMSYNPFAALQWMVDGRTVYGLPTRAGKERIDRAQALRLWTSGSAWFSFAEHERGALAPGMLADFAILSKDYLTVPVAEIGQIRSLLTVVGGRIVHAAAPFSQ